jgi:hypothetical protein
MSRLLTLYHGSHLTVEKPDISFSRDNVDFGEGFYTTPILEQAQNWARRFARSHGHAVLSLYEIDEAALRDNARILEFQSYSDEWLDCIARCRNGERIGDYDVVIGGVANDKVFNTLQLYFDGLVDRREAIKRLQYEKPNRQYCFRSQAVIEAYLEFARSEEFS